MDSSGRRKKLLYSLQLESIIHDGYEIVVTPLSRRTGRVVNSAPIETLQSSAVSPINFTSHLASWLPLFDNDMVPACGQPKG